MIVYDNSHQFRILCQISGSVLPQCLPVGLFGFTIGLALALLRKFELMDDVLGSSDLIEHSFSIQTVAVIIGYLLVIRTNIALGRWMTGVSEIQTMMSKWLDAFDALSGFFAGRGAGATLEERERILNFRIRIAHWFSLMSCLGFYTLRNDGKLEVLDEVPIKEMFPAVKEPGITNRRQSFVDTFTSFPAGNEAARPSELVRMCSTGSSINTLDKRLAQAASNVEENITNTNNADFSQSADNENHELAQGIDLLVLAAPTPEEVMLLNMANDKVNTLCLWIIQAIVLEIRAGTLDTPAPIVSRVFQELSSGILGYYQALKFSIVPFPFPFAQMVSIIMVIVYTGIPLYIDAFTQQVVVTPVLSFLLPFCYCGLERIAIELEEPFGTDDNDVDIEVRHEEFLWALVDVLRMPDVSPKSLDQAIEYKILKGCAQCTSKDVLSEELHKYTTFEEDEGNSSIRSSRGSGTSEMEEVGHKTSMGSEVSGHRVAGTSSREHHAVA